MKVKIRRDDIVEIISGRREDKGKRGRVIKVIPKERRVVVQQVNIRKKHQSQYQTQGRTLTPGIVEFESPIDISNVMLVCSSCDEPTRVGIQRDGDEVHRVCKRCGALVD